MPLRTLQVVNVRWFNATAWYGIALARLLRQAGHESLVVGLEGTESFAKAQSLGLDPVALPLNTTNPLAMPALLADMARLVKRFRPHVVNCHRGEGFLFWGALKTWGNYALVRTRGDQRLPKGNLPNRLLHCHVADGVVATNSVMARHFVQRMGVPAKRVHTILGGVDTGTFRASASGRAAVRAAYGWDDSHFVVGLLGRFDRVKGQKELIDAVALLRAQGDTSIRLMLAGFATATSQEEVEGWIREAGIGDITVITGKHPDVTACIAAMDLGVVASLWSETIARAALEIMACGVPLVSTTVGVMPDLMPVDAMVEPADVAGLARLIGTYRADPLRLATLRNACKARIATLRDEDFVSQTLALYRSVLPAQG